MSEWLLVLTLGTILQNHPHPIGKPFHFWNYFNSPVESFNRSEFIKTPGVLIIQGGCLVNRTPMILIQGVVN